LSLLALAHSSDERKFCLLDLNVFFLVFCSYLKRTTCRWPIITVCGQRLRATAAATASASGMERARAAFRAIPTTILHTTDLPNPSQTSQTLKHSRESVLNCFIIWVKNFTWLWTGLVIAKTIECVVCRRGRRATRVLLWSQADYGFGRELRSGTESCGPLSELRP